ncbi:MAG: FAD-binding oxidoreductase [Alphaproteobacteria bacterium]|nr:FAD-binding oxidoreductase [Alphaproteobacteria bacterium]
MTRPPSPETLERLKAVVGERGLVAEDARGPYLVEWRGRYRGETPLILRPGSTGEVAEIVRLCAAEDVGLVPQGGNTGLVGGQIPFGEVLVSLTRMRRIRSIDPTDMTLTAEAGATLAEVQAAAREAGRLFPLSLASEGTATLGGALSSNAGGLNVLAYGNARDLALGLEVVLADGRVWNGLRRLRKDNTGYDLKQLFIGAEGTLGLVTAATVKLFPAPAALATAFAAVSGVAAAARLLAFVRERSAAPVTALELVPRIGLDFVLRHVADTRDPLPARHDWYVLVELSGAKAQGLDDGLAEILGAAAEAGLVQDAALARSEGERAALWRLRELLSEVQKHEGGSIKNDISVPVSAIPGFIAEATARVERACPGIRPVPFGHIGDGNVHFNLSQPPGADRDKFLARWDELARIVNDVARDFDGSISAEHGLGVMKRDEIARYKDPLELELMRRLKAALDPKGIMNPGKLL